MEIKGKLQQELGELLEQGAEAPLAFSKIWGTISGTSAAEWPRFCYTDKKSLKEGC